MKTRFIDGHRLNLANAKTMADPMRLTGLGEFCRVGRQQVQMAHAEFVQGRRHGNGNGRRNGLRHGVARPLCASAGGVCGAHFLPQADSHRGFPPGPPPVPMRVDSGSEGKLGAVGSLGPCFFGASRHTP